MTSRLSSPRSVGRRKASVVYASRRRRTHENQLSVLFLSTEPIVNGKEKGVKRVWGAHRLYAIRGMSFKCNRARIVSSVLAVRGRVVGSRASGGAMSDPAIPSQGWPYGVSRSRIARRLSVSAYLLAVCVGSSGASQALNPPIDFCKRPEPGSLVPEPQELRSHDGVLDVDLTIHNQRQPDGSIRMTGRIRFEPADAATSTGASGNP
jgi:hypothetical protein